MSEKQSKPYLKTDVPASVERSSRIRPPFVCLDNVRGKVDSPAIEDAFKNMDGK